MQMIAQNAVERVHVVRYVSVRSVPEFDVIAFVSGWKVFGSGIARVEYLDQSGRTVEVTLCADIAGRDGSMIDVAAAAQRVTDRLQAEIERSNAERKARPKMNYRAGLQRLPTF